MRRVGFLSTNREKFEDQPSIKLRYYNSYGGRFLVKANDAGTVTLVNIIASSFLPVRIDIVSLTGVQTTNTLDFQNFQPVPLFVTNLTKIDSLTYFIRFDPTSVKLPPNGILELNVTATSKSGVGLPPSTYSAPSTYFSSSIPSSASDTAPNRRSDVYPSAYATFVPSVNPVNMTANKTHAPPVVPVNKNVVPANKNVVPANTTAGRYITYTRPQGTWQNHPAVSNTNYSIAPGTILTHVEIPSRTQVILFTNNSSELLRNTSSSTTSVPVKVVSKPTAYLVKPIVV